jgi:hypothetical protein
MSKWNEAAYLITDSMPVEYGWMTASKWWKENNDETNPCIFPIYIYTSVYHQIKIKINTNNRYDTNDIIIDRFYVPSLMVVHKRSLITNDLLEGFSIHAASSMMTRRRSVIMDDSLERLSFNFPGATHGHFY